MPPAAAGVPGQVRAESTDDVHVGSDTFRQFFRDATGPARRTVAVGAGGSRHPDRGLGGHRAATGPRATVDSGERTIRCRAAGPGGAPAVAADRPAACHAGRARRRTHRRRCCPRSRRGARPPGRRLERGRVRATDHVRGPRRRRAVAGDRGPSGRPCALDGPVGHRRKRPAAACTGSEHARRGRRCGARAHRAASPRCRGARARAALPPAKPGCWKR